MSKPTLTNKTVGIYSRLVKHFTKWPTTDPRDVKKEIQANSMGLFSKVEENDLLTLLCSALDIDLTEITQL